MSLVMLFDLLPYMISTMVLVSLTGFIYYLNSLLTKFVNNSLLTKSKFHVIMIKTYLNSEKYFHVK